MRADDRVMCPLGERINEVQAKRVLNTGTQWLSDYKYIDISASSKTQTGHNFHPVKSFSKTNNLLYNEFLHLVLSDHHREWTDTMFFIVTVRPEKRDSFWVFLLHTNSKLSDNYVWIYTHLIHVSSFCFILHFHSLSVCFHIVSEHMNPHACTVFWKDG